MKIFYKILGCKMNLLEGEKIAKELNTCGFKTTNKQEQADYIIVNTCAVTGQAEKKSRQAIRSMQSKNPKAKILAFGCGIKASPQVFSSIKNIQCFLSWEEIIDHLKAVSSKFVTNKYKFEHFRTRAYIEIQNGCDNYCTYCIIARLRGKHISRPTENIVREIQEVEKEGIKEVILTGINIGAWGASFSHKAEESKLHELLKVILDQTSISRIRISSLGPEYISDELIKLWASEDRIQRHLHLSLQSGSTNVLKRMKRNYTIEEVDKELRKLRLAIPDIGIAADIIVGFCGETEEDFLQTCALVQKHEFMKLHVFPFSVRQGTAAEKLQDNVIPEIKKERTEKLRKISNNLYKNFVQKNIGKVHQVLVEDTRQKKLKGLTGNYIQIQFPENKELINKIVQVKIGESMSIPVTATKQLY